MKLNYLTNPNNNVQQKMRYFADYFSFANEFLGKHPFVPYDNPLSLLEKILFQIENNFKHCPLYVNSYLSQLFVIHGPFESTIEPFFELATKYNYFKTAEEKKEWLKYHPEFVALAVTLRDNYEANLFGDSHKSLLQMIKCSHPLKKHLKEIQYRTMVIVSLFRLKGHSKGLLDDYVKRILSDDRYVFPLPVDIVKIRETDQYISRAIEFLETRNFDGQFGGLQNLFITEQHKFGNFFFVIDNCFLENDIKETFKIKFDQVTFITPLHSDLNLLRRSMKKDDKENSFKNTPVFFGKNKLLAFVYTGYENHDAKKEACLNTVEAELSNLNQYLNGELKVNPLHYIVYDSFASARWSSKASLLKTSRVRITQYEMEDAAENPYETLRNVKSPAKAIILQNEKVFLKAFARAEVEYYWIFIENIFAPIYSNSEQIRKSAGKLLIKLLEDMKEDFLIQIGSMLIPFGFNHMEEDLTDDDVLNIHAEIFVNKNFKFDFSQYIKKIKSPALKHIINHYHQFNSPALRHDWRVHFSNLLIDLYGFRNSLLHSGKTDKYSAIKFQDVLPKLISRARWKIIRSCQKNDTLSYQELIGEILS